MRNLERRSWPLERATPSMAACRDDLRPNQEAVRASCSPRVPPRPSATPMIPRPPTTSSARPPIVSPAPARGAASDRSRLRRRRRGRARPLPSMASPRSTRRASPGAWCLLTGVIQSSHRLDRLGMGRYQVYLLVLCGCACRVSRSKTRTDHGHRRMDGGQRACCSCARVLQP